MVSLSVIFLELMSLIKGISAAIVRITVFRICLKTRRGQFVPVTAFLTMFRLYLLLMC